MSKRIRKEKNQVVTDVASTKKRRFFSRLDVLLLLAVLIVCGVFFLWLRKRPNDATTVAEVIIDGQVVDRIELMSGQEKDFVYKERPAVLLHRYDDGTIAFVESDCPDKICINTGRLKLPYHTAACLPNLVIVNVVQIPGKTQDASSATTEELDLVR